MATVLFCFLKKKNQNLKLVTSRASTVYKPRLSDPRAVWPPRDKKEQIATKEPFIVKIFLLSKPENTTFWIIGWCVYVCRNVRTFVCIFVYVYGHALGGWRTTLGVSPQVLSTFLFHFHFFVLRDSLSWALNSPSRLGWPAIPRNPCHKHGN